jgi:hypothetical protein
MLGVLSGKWEIDQIGLIDGFVEILLTIRGLFEETATWRSTKFAVILLLAECCYQTKSILMAEKFLSDNQNIFIYLLKILCQSKSLKILYIL